MIGPINEGRWVVDNSRLSVLTRLAESGVSWFQSRSTDIFEGIRRYSKVFGLDSGKGGAAKAATNRGHNLVLATLPPFALPSTATFASLQGLLETHELVSQCYK